MLRRGWTPVEWRSLSRDDQTSVLAYDLRIANEVGETIGDIRDRLLLQESLYVDTALLLEILRTLLTR